MIPAIAALMAAQLGVAPPGTPWLDAASYGSTSNSGTHTVTRNIAPVNGSNLFLMVYTDGTTITTPSGWTLAGGASTTAGVQRLSCFTKTASSDGTTQAVALGASAPCAIIAITWPSGYGTADDTTSGTINNSPAAKNISGTSNSSGSDLMFGIISYIPVLPGHATLGPWAFDAGYTLVASVNALGSGLNYDLVVCYKIELVSGTNKSFNVTSTFTDAASTTPWLYLSYKSP